MEKLRLGICDDETQDLAQILEMVKQYDEDSQLQITTFLHAKDLLYAEKASGFDITILDIEMEPPTGFDIAKKLISMPNPPIVIFATKSNAYALKGYGSQYGIFKSLLCVRPSLKPWMRPLLMQQHIA